jgi:hypothetical protein
MYQHVLRMYAYVLDTDQYILVCTWCVPVHTWMYHTEPCFTGFLGTLRDANTRVPDVQQQHTNLDIDDQSSPFTSLFTTSTLWYQAKWQPGGCLA